MRKLRIGGSIAGAVAIAVILLIVFLSGGKPKPAASTTPSSTPTATGSPIAGCTEPSPAPTPNGKQYSKPPKMTIDKTKIYLATFQTTCGVIKMRMDPKVAPASVNSFVFLAKQGFYDGTKIGRVQSESDFAIVQAGTQTGTISGGAGYFYKGETPSPTTAYTRGTVAMANSGSPASNGSQFFFVVHDWASLPKQYSVLGKTDDAISLASLDRMILAQGQPIEANPPGSLGLSPNPSIYILSVAVEELSPR